MNLAGYYESAHNAMIIIGFSRNALGQGRLGLVRVKQLSLFGVSVRLHDR